MQLDEAQVVASAILAAHAGRAQADRPAVHPAPITGEAASPTKVVDARTADIALGGHAAIVGKGPTWGKFSTCLVC